jgi:hypothetical protein
VEDEASGRSAFRLVVSASRKHCRRHAIPTFQTNGLPDGRGRPRAGRRITKLVSNTQQNSLAAAHKTHWTWWVVCEQSRERSFSIKRHTPPLVIAAFPAFPLINLFSILSLRVATFHKTPGAWADEIFALPLCCVFL